MWVTVMSRRPSAGGDADREKGSGWRPRTLPTVYLTETPKPLTQEDSKKTRQKFSREDLDVNFRQALYKSSVVQTHSFLMKHNRKERWASLYSFTSFPGSGWTETRTCVTTILPYSPKPAQQRSAIKITNRQLPIITTILMNIIMNFLLSEICGISSHKLHELVKCVKSSL